jgi:hypothetical protein|tara:strand:+ start:195 stop:377 length:183 start_codon:yes stop_codon:yes gene_type:complete
MNVPNEPTMFTLATSIALNEFISEMQPDLEMCCDFVEAQGVELTPKIVRKISNILEFANA